MRNTTIILLSLGLIALALARMQRNPRGPFRNLKGWQSLLGLLAVVMAVVVLLNPDLFALSLLGDSAFFDMLALALSVQMLVSLQWAWRNVSRSFARSVRWLGIPSPGFRYLMCVSTITLISAISVIQKIAHRFAS